MAETFPRFVVKDVDRYFGFLYQRGFSLAAADYSPQLFGNWMARLESASFVVHLTSDRDHIILEFSPAGDRGTRNRITIERLIYNISDGKDVIPPFRGNVAWGKKRQLKRLADLVQRYLDQITAWYNTHNA